MKQTAVEFLIDKIDKHLIHLSMGSIFEQAKEMEKEQIKNAYRTGDYDVIDNPDREAEQYYNETFKSE